MTLLWQPYCPKEFSISASHLPAPSTPFVGRVEELSNIAALIANPNCRLLTLVGPGGIGKTRLAIESIKPIQDDFAHGVHFVNFQPIDSISLVAATIATEIDAPLSEQDDLQTRLLHFLASKEMLLVLDNFEHLLNGTGLLSNLLAAAPGLKLLVTSREALNLEEEWLFPVSGMPFPETDAVSAPETYTAVQLFVERAHRVRRDFSLMDERLGVIHLCQMVEGMPLAIELAATWIFWKVISATSRSATEVCRRFLHSRGDSLRRKKAACSGNYPCFGAGFVVRQPSRSPVHHCVHSRRW
jgi:hypothetical protein